LAFSATVERAVGVNRNLVAAALPGEQQPLPHRRTGATLDSMEQARQERLVQELAALSEDERRDVVASARLRALRQAPGRAATATLPWASLRSAIGLVQGAPADAVEDCDNLYDG
jgi:hypothetical protein